MPPKTPAAFFQNFVVANFEKRWLCLVKLICGHRYLLLPLIQPNTTAEFLLPPKGVNKSRNRYFILITANINLYARGGWLCILITTKHHNYTPAGATRPKGVYKSRNRYFILITTNTIIIRLQVITCRGGLALHFDKHKTSQLHACRCVPAARCLPASLCVRGGGSRSETEGL